MPTTCPIVSTTLSLSTSLPAPLVSGARFAAAIGARSALRTSGMESPAIAWPSSIVSGGHEVARVTVEADIDEEHGGRTLLTCRAELDAEVNQVRPEMVSERMGAALSAWEAGLLSRLTQHEPTAPLDGIVDSYNHRLAWVGARVRVMDATGAICTTGNLVRVERTGHAIVSIKDGETRVFDAQNHTLRAE